MRHAAVLALAGVVAEPVQAAVERPGLFAFAQDITLEGDAKVYELTVPRSVYERVTRADLGDVRVFNAAREIVPHAFRPRRQAPEPAPVGLALFPVRSAEQRPLGDIDLRVEVGPGGEVSAVHAGDAEPGSDWPIVGYLADASRLARPAHAVDITLAEGAQEALARVTIESSDDLHTWTTLASDAPIVQLTSGVNRLEQRRIAFTPRRFQYLRISWSREQPLALASVRALPGPASAEAGREWTRLRASPVAGVRGRYELDLGARLPIDRLRIALPQPNTIAGITLYSRSRPTETWRFVAGATVFRLRDDRGEALSDDIALRPSGDRYWRFEMEAHGGVLVDGAMEVSAGWVPHRLVFAPRGAPPFMLAYGSTKVRPFAFPVSTLVPGGADDPEADAVLVGSARADSPFALVDDAAEPADKAWKRALIAPALAVGVLIAGWMLARAARAPPPPPPRRRARLEDELMLLDPAERDRRPTRSAMRRRTLRH
jgi:hypothetical protein